MRTLIACLAVVTLNACAASSKAEDTKAEETKLMQLSRDWSTAAGKGDVDAILAYWADDAVVMPPGEAPVRGKAAIRALVEGSGPGFSIKWEPLEAHVSAAGDMAYMIERNEITFNDSTGVNSSGSRGSAAWCSPRGCPAALRSAPQATRPTSISCSSPTCTGATTTPR